MTHSPLASAASLGLGYGGEVQRYEFSQGALALYFKADAKVCDSWLFVYGGSMWEPALRAIVFGMALMWCFLGVAIIADIFMQAIEVITSKTNTVIKDGVTVSIKSWNPTIANLSLMALGSSAPEILLSVIETVGGLGSEPGELGASTIVGSAAFNLLFISAICVLAIPEGELRRVQETKVFACTAFASVWAYIWLLICVSFNGPGEVSLTEAILTVAQFFVLLIVAYLFDINVCSKGGDRKKGLGRVDKRKLEAAFKTSSTNNKGGALSEVLAQAQPPVSYAQYRIGVTRFGGADPSKTMGPRNEIVPIDEEMGEMKTDNTITFSFEHLQESCMEDCGTIPIKILRTGGDACSVTCYTVEGTAVAGTDYKTIPEKAIHFAEGEREKIVNIEIIDNDKPEPDRRFTIHIKDPNTEGRDTQVILGNLRTTEVTIVDDDVPGSVLFSAETMQVADTDEVAVVVVIREGGCRGKVSINYHTQPGSADPGQDYEAVRGTLTFAHKELKKEIKIPILNDFRYEDDEDFEVCLHKPDVCDLGSRPKITVTISSNQEIKNLVDKAFAVLKSEKDGLKNFFRRGCAQQFRDALAIDPNSSNLNFTLHFLSIFWKVLFAFCPPPAFGGGWPCFGVALAFIGALTALVGELASLFGCSIGLKDPVTAITFVALGTSLPDLFASMQAASQAPSADSAIGNITGSNAVNVFLGLGIPWIIGAAYSHGSPDGDFKVPEGSLSGSVIVFTICALVCLATLVMRRFTVGGELGGTKKSKYPTAVLFIGLWFLYVLLSSLQSYDYIYIGF